MRQDFNWRTAVNKFLLDQKTAPKEILLQRTRQVCFPEKHTQRRVGVRVEIPDQDRVATSFHAIVHEYVSSIRRIQERGGSIVIIQPPSTGRDYLSQPVEDSEKQLLPREKYFDLLVKEAHVPSLHSEDDARLDKLPGVDGSHLSATDALVFTHVLANWLKKVKRP